MTIAECQVETQKHIERGSRYIENDKNSNTTL
jgi:hypothetical protein